MCIGPSYRGVGLEQSLGPVMLWEFNGSLVFSKLMSLFDMECLAFEL